MFIAMIYTGLLFIQAVGFNVNLYFTYKSDREQLFFYFDEAISSRNRSSIAYFGLKKQRTIYLPAILLFVLSSKTTETYRYVAIKHLKNGIKLLQ